MRTCPALLLATLITVLAAPALAVPPALGGLSFLPGDDVVQVAAGMQHSREIAAGEGQYLAVWIDDRTAITRIPTMSGGPAFDRHIGSMWDLYAAAGSSSGRAAGRRAAARSSAGASPPISRPPAARSRATCTRRPSGSTAAWRRTAPATS
jgi:hypothetical protein